MTKIVYLTIDDAPSPDCVNKLDFLDKHDIKAIWFVEGRWLDVRFDVAVDMLKRGHILGNHAYSHPNFADIPLETCRHEINETHYMLEKVYQRAGIAWLDKYFRFPYGNKGQSADHIIPIQRHLRSLGYAQPLFFDITYTWFRDQLLNAYADWFWTYDSLDWSAYSDHPDHDVDSPEKVLARLDENVPDGGRGINYAGSADIVLVHDHVTPDNLFQQIIEKLLTKGVKFRLPQTEFD